MRGELSRVTKRGGMRVTKNVKVRRNVRCTERERGFSLIEIVIVGAIILAIAVIAVPKSIQSLRAYRLATAVSMTNEMLMDARMDAIKRNRTSWLTVDKVAKTAQVHTTDGVGATINVGFAQNLPQGVNLVSTLNSIDLGFDSLGRCSAGTQTFTISESGSGLKQDITISPAGKITVSAMYLGG
jgi:Tfp pilus assembly protein FimT